MSANEITTKIESLRELEELIEEAKAEAETLRDEIKAEMLNRNIDKLLHPWNYRPVMRLRNWYTALLLMALYFPPNVHFFHHTFIKKRCQRMTSFLCIISY